MGTLLLAIVGFVLAFVGIQVAVRGISDWNDPRMTDPNVGYDEYPKNVMMKSGILFVAGVVCIVFSVIGMFS